MSGGRPGEHRGHAALAVALAGKPKRKPGRPRGATGARGVSLAARADALFAERIADIPEHDRRRMTCADWWKLLIDVNAVAGNHQAVGSYVDKLAPYCMPKLAATLVTDDPSRMPRSEAELDAEIARLTALVGPVSVIEHDAPDAEPADEPAAEQQSVCAFEGPEQQSADAPPAESKKVAPEVVSEPPAPSDWHVASDRLAAALSKLSGGG